jgi:hypothetical protein
MYKSKIAGILSIVSGGLGIGTSLMWMVMIVIFSTMIRMPGFMPATPGTDDQMFYTMFSIWMTVYIILIVGMILVSALAITGGVFALKKKRWGVALAGSIGSIIAFMPCGIAALIFVITGKEEFQGTDSSIISQD